MIYERRYTSTSSPATTPKMLVPNCSQSTKEQANTISKVKLNKIGFRVLVYGFGFKNLISKEEINIHKIIQN